LTNPKKPPPCCTFDHIQNPNIPIENHEILLSKYCFPIPILILLNFVRSANRQQPTSPTRFV
jgi:hypothetical protein